MEDVKFGPAESGRIVNNAVNVWSLVSFFISTRGVGRNRQRASRPSNIIAHVSGDTPNFHHKETLINLPIVARDA